MVLTPPSLLSDPSVRFAFVSLARFARSLSQGYDLGKRIVYTATPNRTSQALTVPELAFAGFFSAIPATLVAGPAERVKVLLQVQGQGGAAQQYSGPFDVVRQLYKQGGLRSIFRGTVATLGRDGPGSAA